MSIYTKTGDSGETSIIGGRVLKDDIQVEAYGTVDEANSFIGLAISHLTDDVEVKEELLKIQHELFDCGGDLSMKAGAEEKYPYKVTDEMVHFLEQRIDQYLTQSPPLDKFILPGGSQAASYLHVARTVARRAERCVVTLTQRQAVNPYVRKYLNRVSDYLFALARVINVRQNIQDIEYIRSASVFKKGKK